jgi:hypothetical protein
MVTVQGIQGEKKRTGMLPHHETPLHRETSVNRAIKEAVIPGLPNVCLEPPTEDPRNARRSGQPT